MILRFDRRLLVALLAAVSCLLASGVAAQRATAALEVTEFSGLVADSNGDSETRAAIHPYSATTTIRFATEPQGIATVPKESVKDMQVDLPAGFAGNPQVTPTLCTAEQLANKELTPNGFYSQCPDSSQVGVVSLYFAQPFLPEVRTYGVYAMEPRPGAPAQFGFLVDSGALQTPIMFTANVRPDDYGIRVNVSNTPQPLAIVGTSLTLWGVPADSSHDSMRGRCLLLDGTSAGECPVDAPPLPFLTNPSNCAAGPLTTRLKANSWQNPDQYAVHSFDEDTNGNPTAVTGCEQVPFEIDASIQADTTRADSPMGLEVELSMPQEENPVGRANGYLKRATVTLPEGTAVDPASAAGLGACSPPQVGLGQSGPATCPDSSKLGTVEIETPLLERPLTGSVFLAEQSNNPFGSLLAIYLVAEGQGVVVKLPGRIVTDAATGRVTAVFDDNPQLPFERLRVAFFGGPGASLVSPPTCGATAAAATFSSWSASDPDNPAPAEQVTASSPLAFDRAPGGGPCGYGFAPAFEAGTTNPVAGAHSPFLLRLSREDGTQRLSTVETTLPPGLLGKLRGIPYCSDAALAGVSGAAGSGAEQLASPTCPAASRIGAVSVGAGAGPNPLRVRTGTAYLAGPYKGAPLSAAFLVPALAGPFDLGTVLVRAALEVDPSTALITAASDPLPTILHGIPLNLREVTVRMDRPEFMLNPTSCRPLSFGGSVTSTQGGVAPLAERFQVANCERLAFKPKLSLNLKGATKRSGHPQLTAVLTQKPGGSNIARASIAMPRSEFLAQDHIRTVCTRVQFAADACPKGSVYGRARAFSPLLDRPLEGPVYLRSSNNTLPDLVADLRGQIDIELVGRIDSLNGGIRTTFDTVPDAPVSKFVLKMHGGQRSLLENSENLCAAKNRATVTMKAHSGKTQSWRPLVRARCGKGGQR